MFRESPVGVAAHVMGVVHGAAGYLPELVQYLATMHPELVVKAGETGETMESGHHVTVM